MSSDIFVVDLSCVQIILQMARIRFKIYAWITPTKKLTLVWLCIVGNRLTMYYIMELNTNYGSLLLKRYYFTLILLSVPTLTISTGLLVIQVPSSGVVSCTPSDPEAPVQWTTSMGDIPVGFPVIFSRDLSQMATFTAVSRSNLTDEFICDLINVEEPNQAVDPQRVSVRFVSGEQV